MSQRNEHPSLDTAPAGSIRFNTDSSMLEIYNGEQWWNINSASVNEQTNGARSLWAGGNTPTYFNNIQFIQITTTGNAADFGDLTRVGNQINGVSSRIRAVYGAGYQGSGTGVDNVIDFVNIVSKGDATNFGDLTTLRSGVQPVQNSTRGIFVGGMDHPAQNSQQTIDYVTISTTGDAVDFGDMDTNIRNGSSACSPTRGIVSRGNPSTNIMQYLTISTLGDMSDFGDATTADTAAVGTSSNAIRGINFTASYSPNTDDVIDYITIATLGNALDFGDLNHISMNGAAVCASTTRAIAGGGFDGGIQPELDYVQIMTLGNAKDFGDLAEARSQPGAVSNAHGGLAG